MSALLPWCSLSSLITRRDMLFVGCTPIGYPAARVAPGLPTGLVLAGTAGEGIWSITGSCPCGAVVAVGGTTVWLLLLLSLSGRTHAGSGEGTVTLGAGAAVSW
ncbi:hypothetical protein BDV93DRAFT_566362 [Ceratobasidium sp. AG-I]|nr:hypothetical protein BDV93DRAFT_566362 [Ceratobasidium sp. AG-I]